MLGAVLQGQTIPRPSPNYTITLPDGQPVTLNQYKGKVIALEFLLTTCPHCQTTARIMTKLEKELGPKGFQPLGAAINPNPDIADFRRQTGASYPIGTAVRETVYGYLEHSIMSPQLMMPQLVFIDKTGTIRAQYAGTDTFFEDQEKNIRAMVEKLTSEGAAPSKKTATPTPATKKKVS